MSLTHPAKPRSTSSTQQQSEPSGFELGYPQLTPSLIYTYSLSAKALADACQIGNNSAHITMRINFLHEQVTGKVIELKFIITENEVADVLTKLLPVEFHRRHSEILLLRHTACDYPEGRSSHDDVKAFYVQI
jgi:hypothetical protein